MIQDEYIDTLRSPIERQRLGKLAKTGTLMPISRWLLRMRGDMFQAIHVSAEIRRSNIRKARKENLRDHKTTLFITRCIYRLSRARCVDDTKIIAKYYPSRNLQSRKIRNVIFWISISWMFLLFISFEISLYDYFVRMLYNVRYVCNVNRIYINFVRNLLLLSLRFGKMFAKTGRK